MQCNSQQLSDQYFSQMVSSTFPKYSGPLYVFYGAFFMFLGHVKVSESYIPFAFTILSRAREVGSPVNSPRPSRPDKPTL